MHFFVYGETEINYLKSKDKTLAHAIERIGIIRREVNPDLFSALVHSIVGQQISTKAQATIWKRIEKEYETISPESIAAYPEERLQGCGISYRKARYIRGVADKVVDGSLDVERLYEMPDGDICAAMTKLDGIGVWTAEMLMLFSMQRMDILSYGDLAIHRGLRMLYRHKEVSRKLFEKYRRRYSPYGSVASLYLWAIAGGAIPELRDTVQG